MHRSTVTRLLAAVALAASASTVPGYAGPGPDLLRPIGDALPSGGLIEPEWAGADPDRLADGPETGASGPSAWLSADRPLPFPAGLRHRPRTDRSVPDTLVATDRPFRHRDHEGLSCLECHTTEEGHGVITVRTARDCAACHHDPGRGYECQACHAEADLPPPGPVAAIMDLTVRDEPLTRDLPFDHGIHAEVACGECHTGPVMLEVETECAACHDDHHRPAAECSACHPPAEPEVHGLEVHLTCSTADCHAGEAGERPALSRPFCLMCHTDEVDHEPGLECHQCHMVPHDPLAGAR